MKQIDKKEAFTYAGAGFIYIAAILMMIILPIKLIPAGPINPAGTDPNVASNNNWLPSSCPLYTVIASRGSGPDSNGPLQLPFQRPISGCRTFTSDAMETLITNMTSRMVDKDLARLFENAYPNTLGTSLPFFETEHRYDRLMVQFRRLGSISLCHNWRHPSTMASRRISPIRPILTPPAIRCQSSRIVSWPH
jgi:hypothetical protein